MKFIVILFVLSAAITARSQLPNEIVFTGEGRVYVIRANGTLQTPITSPGFGANRPRWSRDGTQIVFTKGNVCLPDYSSHIWKMNADGSNQTMLGGVSNIPRVAVFSPHADRFAYVGVNCFWAGEDAIFITDADGNNVVWVTDVVVSGGGLDWSPVGERLVYSDYVGVYVVRSINADGTDGLALTTPTQGSNFDPVWSPDGSKIAFVSRRDGNSEIYTMNPDGSSQVRITYSLAEDRDPTWSPDGTRIAFSSNRNGPYNIHVVNADGTDPIQITHNAFDSVSPHWNPDVPLRRAPFDFDGDNETDVSIARANAGSLEWWMRSSSNDSVSAVSFGSPSDVIAPADFTGDGKTDVTVFRFADGNWYVLRSEDSTYFSIPFGMAGDAPVPRDYDSDGRADFAIYRPTTNTWWIQRSTAGLMTATFGTLEDVPVPADYDGDGKADIAVFRGSTGQWWIDRSAAGLIVVTFGTPEDLLVPGDYTGDGKDDIAVWRPEDGNWYVLRSEDGSYFAFPWGLAGDVPAPGDYDGDGKTDAAIFRAGTWYINRTTGTPLITSFGISGDYPVPNAHVR